MSVTIIPAENYPIEVGPLKSVSLEEYLNRGENKKSKIFILADEWVMQHCFPKLASEIPSVSRAEILEIESGEENKNIEICTRIWQALTELGADRNSIFINLGGGVISDLGGFIAGTFKRGIRFINIPTTLLSMVDASVGGKTGIDLDNLKNQIGIFNTPDAIYIDPAFLISLPKRQMLAGLAEIIKHGLISDRDYWNQIKKSDFSDSSVWEKLIIPSIKIKNHIVQSDPTEKGLRKILNFGHTIGHAVESYSLETGGSSLLHGEAIAIGMICESFLSVKHENLNKTELTQITEFIAGLYPFFNLEELAHHRILELMKNDKKNKNNQINFTLLQSIGSATIDNFISPAEIKNALNFYKSVYGK